MLNDFITATRHWRIIHILGMSTLRSRFARSKLGQLWISMSVFINISLIGIVWSYIWKVPVKEYLPLLGIGHVIYSFASQTISESTNILINNSKLYLNQKLPLFTSTLAHFYKSLIIFVYNLPMVALLYIYSENWNINFDFLFLPGALLSFLFIILSSHLVALICIRFRDLIQLVTLAIQTIYMLTPVMWKIDMIPVQYQKYVYINPFASILEIFRNPIFGHDVSYMAYCSIAAWTSLVFLVTFIIHKKLARNIVFWM